MLVYVVFINTENPNILTFPMQLGLSRPIDLLENKAIKNPYIRRNIDSSKLLIYARQ
jgi:hypothetical protein